MDHDDLHGSFRGKDWNMTYVTAYQTFASESAVTRVPAEMKFLSCGALVRINDEVSAARHGNEDRYHAVLALLFDYEQRRWWYFGLLPHGMSPPF